MNSVEAEDIAKIEEALARSRTRRKPQPLAEVANSLSPHRPTLEPIKITSPTNLGNVKRIGVRITCEHGHVCHGTFRPDSI